VEESGWGKTAIAICMGVSLQGRRRLLKGEKRTRGNSRENLKQDLGRNKRGEEQKGAGSQKRARIRNPKGGGSKKRGLERSARDWDPHADIYAWRADN